MKFCKNILFTQKCSQITMRMHYNYIMIYRCILKTIIQIDYKLTNRPKKVQSAIMQCCLILKFVSCSLPWIGKKIRLLLMYFIQVSDQRSTTL